MRFNLIMELDEKYYPLDYRRVVISYIKNALSKVEDGKYFSQFYKDNIQKDYCFSVRFANPKFRKEKIELDNKEIVIAFSTANSKVAFYLRNIFTSQMNIAFKIPLNNSMTLKKIVTENREVVIKSNKVLFKTSSGSSLCVREHIKEGNKDFYPDFRDDKFLEILYSNIKNQALKAGFSTSIAENIKFVPVKCKNVLVKHYGMYINTTAGVFEMEGDSRLLQYLYDVGIGSRRSAGFSMVDIVKQC